MVKKAIISIVVALLLTFALLGVFIVMQPDEFTISRKASIAASPDRVFAEVNDFHKWDAWSPWAKLDPKMKTEISGPETGKGAVYYWTGDQEVGEGKMTIIESTPPSLVKIDLHFIKPFDSSSTIDIKISPNGPNSDVEWTMNGKHNFMSKAFSVFVDMDKAIGADFERGLSQLKSVAESPAK
ncbi:MAG: SRPBCC family protein [Acidobacteria bacterium]|nr:SRPBCC family protein [Acidobacteriota bacterium]